jgi:cytochrome c5
LASDTWFRAATKAAATILLMLPGVGVLNASEGARYDPETRAYNLAHGRVVFSEKCLECHERGRHDAPVLGNIDDWRERLDQPLSTLIQHAIEGHGDMPARGDHDLTDQQVAAAVAYVVDRARLIIAGDDLNNLPPTGAGPTEPQLPSPKVSDETIVQMLFMLVGKERWK